MTHLNRITNFRNPLKPLLVLCGVIMRYFTEPYRKYDGEWRGFIYYEKMADRRFDFKFTFILISIIIIYVALYNAL